MSNYTAEQLKKFEEARKLLDKQLSYINDDDDPRSAKTEKQLRGYDRVSHYMKTEYKHKSGAEHVYAKAIICGSYGRFDTISQAKHSIGDKCDISWQLKKIPHLYYYEEDGPGKPTYEKVFVTPFGESKSKKYVFCKAIMAEDPYAKYYTSISELQHGWWGMMTKLFPDQYKKETKEKVDYTLLDTSTIEDMYDELISKFCNDDYTEMKEKFQHQRTKNAGMYQNKGSVTTPEGNFKSTQEYCEKLNVKKFPYGKLKSQPHLYYYDCDGPGPEPKRKIYSIDNNNFTSVHDAYEWYGKNYDEFQRKNASVWFMNKRKKFPDRFKVC